MAKMPVLCEAWLLLLILGGISIVAGAESTTPQASPGESQPAGVSAENAILAFRVVSETSDSLVLDIDYQYSGDHGSGAAMAAYLAIDGKAARYNAFKPALLKPGRGTVRVSLSCMRQPKPVVSSQLSFQMYCGNPFLERLFDYHKTWSWTGQATSQPVESPRFPGAPFRSAAPPNTTRPATRVPPQTTFTPNPASRRPRSVSGQASRPSDLRIQAKAASQTVYKRWALVGTPQLEKAGLPDVVTVALSHVPGIQLVERSEIQQVTKELTVGELLGGDAAGKRLKLGRLLKADALILLAEDKGEREDKQECIRIVISETRWGARLQLDSVLRPVDRTEELSGRIAQLITRTRDRYPEGVQRIVAVPPFVCRDIMDTYLPLRSRFANVLESALAVQAGTAVLEIEEAKAIRAEQDLAGGDVGLRIVPVFVQGEFRVTKSEGKEPVHMEIEVIRASGTQKIERDLPTVEQAVSFLETDAAAGIIGVSAQQLRRSLSRQSQIRLLAERADVFARRGEFIPASNLREASLLLDRKDAEQNERLIREYLTLAAYPESVFYWKTWRTISKEEAINNFRRRVAFWTRAAELLESAIRRYVFSCTTAERQAAELRGTLQNLMKATASCRITESPIYDRQTAEAFQKEEARCAELYRSFARNVIPAIGILGQRPHTSWGTKLAGQGWNMCGLLKLALEPEYQNCMGRPLTKADLEHFAYVLLNVPPDVRMESRLLIQLFRNMSEGDDFRREFTSEQYLEFVERLKHADQEVARLYGELGALCYEYAYGRNGQRMPDEELAKALDSWEAHVVAYHKRIHWGSYDGWIKLIRANLGPLAPAKGPLPPLPPRVSLDIHCTSEVSFQPLPITLQRLSGETVTLGRDASWDDRNGYPLRITRGSGCDILWNYAAIWVLRPPNALRELVLFREKDQPSLRDVTWDGEHIWAMTASSGVRVYSLDGGLVAQAGPEDGLPTAENGAGMAPLSPGRVLAVGSLGLRNRAWCATLTLSGREVKHDIFHEATFARARAQQEKLPEDDPRVTFVPERLYQVPSRPADAPAQFLLACRHDPKAATELGSSAPYTLWLVPDERRVTSAHFELGRGSNYAESFEYCFLENGDCLLANRNLIQLWLSPPHRKDNEPAVRTLHTARDSFDGDLFVHDGFAYAPKWYNWVRIDLKSLNVEPLAIRQGKVKPKFPHWGVAEGFGPVVWDEELGQFFKVIVSPVRVPEPQQVEHHIAELAAAVKANPRSESPLKRKTSYLYTAGRLESARAACLAWVEALPASIEARYALVEIERKIRSGLGPNDKDRAWSEYPQPTFAAWRLFHDPVNSSIDATALKKAIRLPFAADRTEWYIAEFGAVDAASYRYRGKRYDDVIAICDSWEAAAKAQKGGTDASYYAFRAAALLALGEFEKARKDTQLAVEEQAKGRIWAGDTHQLLEAVRAKDKGYVHKFTDPSSHQKWIAED